MWDDGPPRSARGMRGGDPNASRGGMGRPTGYHSPNRPTSGNSPNSPNSPYRPYGETSSRMPAQRGTLGSVAGVRGGDPDMSGGGWTAAELQAVRKHRLGIAIFHDGNPGHLWRGEVASRLGEVAIGVGIVMWLYNFSGLPLDIAYAVAALGLPYLFAGMLTARLENATDPGVALKWIGRLRILFTLALVAMHYHTILPVVYLLLFLISLTGRLRDGARTGAIRACLAPGELEHVADDMHIGSTIVAVLGPLVATLLFIVMGERILLVSIGAAIFFLISLNSESFLDALPANRRAFLLATPESVTLPDDADEADDVLAAHRDDDDDDDTTPEQRREQGLPEWYQQGPTTAAEALADLRAGLGLAGSTGASAVALWALAALSLIGGGLAVLEVFYVTTVLRLPSFYLGPLLAAEGAGLALGVLLASLLLARKQARIALLGGVVGTGAALALLVLLPKMPLPLAIAALLGAANALAVSGARHALSAGFTGIERRALAAAENWVPALGGVVGALAFAKFSMGSQGTHLHRPFPGWSIPNLFQLMGLALVLAGVLFAGFLVVGGKQRATKAKGKGKNAGKNASGTKGRRPTRDDEDEDEDEDSRYLPATGEHDAWDDEDDDEDDDRFGASYGYTGDYDAADTGGYDAYDDEDEDDEPRPGRGGSSARRPLPRNNRPRW